MPFVIKKIEQQRILVVLFWGELDDQTLIDYMSTLSTSNFAQEHLNVLLFVDQKASIKVGAGLLRHSAKQPGAFHPLAKRVIFASSDIAFGLTRLYLSSTESDGSPNQYLVTTVDEAASALEVEAEELETILEEMRR